MKKIKILFTISNLNIGGPQKSLLALLDTLDYDIFDITLCSLKQEGLLKPFYNKNIKFLQAPEIVIAATLPKYNFFRYLSFMFFSRNLSMFFSYIKSILICVLLNKNMNQERQKFWKKHHLKLPKIEGEYDLAFGILGLSTYVIVDLVNSKKKYHWIRSDTRILNRDINIDAEYYKRLDGSLAVSKETSKIFEEIYPFMKGKIHVFYNYIPVSFYESMKYDSSILKVDEKTWKIVTVSRLDPLKGLELAIEACSILISENFNIKWFVLGGGEYKNEIVRMINEKGVKDHFILLDFQLNTFGFIRDSDIFVHPSRTEGKSNAVDEAKYIGKPIIVTNYDTVGEQIQHNINGLICTMDGKNIADSIIKVIQDDKLRKKLITNCLVDNVFLENSNNFFADLLKDRRKY